MAILPYFNFPGTCREALEFYGKAFGVKPDQVQTFGDVPGGPGFPMDEESKKRILHARMEIFGTVVQFSDVPPGREVTPGNNLYLSLTTSDLDELKAVFGRLKEGGTVMMELQETFFSKCYGFLTDKFGTGWMFHYEE